jgi:hypothetical protein
MINTILTMIFMRLNTIRVRRLVHCTALFCVLCLSSVTIASGQVSPCPPNDCGNPAPVWTNGAKEFLLTNLSPPCTLTVEYRYRQCITRLDIEIISVVIQGNCSSLHPNYILNLATNLLIQSNPDNWQVGTLSAPKRWRVIRPGCVRVHQGRVVKCGEECCVREVAVYAIDSQSPQPCGTFFDWENTNYVWWDNTCPTNLPTPCFDACKFDIYNSLNPTQYP